MGGRAADIKQDSSNLAVLGPSSELHPEMRGKRTSGPSLIFTMSRERRLKVGEAALEGLFP